MYVVLEQEWYYSDKPSPKVVTNTLEDANEWVARKKSSLDYQHQDYFIIETPLFMSKDCSFSSKNSK